MSPEEEKKERALMKDAVKEGIKEWLDDKFAAFGKWAALSFAALALAALVYFILAANGWKAPH